MPKVPSVHYYREAFNVYQKYRRLLRTGGEGLKRVRGRAGIDVIMNNKSRISSISKRSIILKKKKSHLKKQGTVHQERMRENRSLPKNDEKDTVTTRKKTATATYDSRIQSPAYLMSGEKPDRATSVYIPEPHGPIT